MTTLPFRITMVDLPAPDFCEHASIEAGLQHGRDVVQSRAPAAVALDFTGELRLKSDSPADGADPVFLGPFTHGPPKARFLYLVWTGEIDGRRAMFRRMKIHLRSITWDRIRDIQANAGSVLAVEVSGRDCRGGPACASVPLLRGGWRVVRPERE